MGLILAPNGLSATQKREGLTREDIKLVTDFERWCERRGLRLDLLCSHCYENDRYPRCHGNNSRDATEYKIACECTERVYGSAQISH